MNGARAGPPAAELSTRPRTLCAHGHPDGRGILCLAGFGDDSTMFEPMLATDLASAHRWYTVDLPGFGDEPPFADRFATLSHLAGFLSSIVVAEGIDTVLAHSASSVIAGIAASDSGSGIRTILSLEGNLTEDDAYFSSIAAEYDTPAAFREAFLSRLDEAATDPIMARYRSRVAGADPHSLWILGNEVAAYSTRRAPGGDLLAHPGRAHYLYNPDNCAEASLRWLERSGLPATLLPGASHWATLDAPELVASAVVRVLGRGRRTS